MPRGGRREGTPGKAYGNRSDLALPPTAAKGQAYGEAGKQLASQKIVPMAGAPTGQVPQGGPPAPAPPAGGPPMPLPGQITPLSAPSERPGEPLTAGMAMGAGPGAEANPFNAVGGADDAVMAIRAAYRAYPSEDLRMILERIDLGDMQ